MVNLKTEKIRCILCNKSLDSVVGATHELTICSECQAYFCPDCLKAIRQYEECPAANILGVHEHELKFLKILPPKPSLTHHPLGQKLEVNKVKILSKKQIKILDQKEKNPSKSKKDQGKLKNAD